MAISTLTRRTLLGSAGATALAGTIPLRAEEPSVPAGRPNILFIMADDMGWADLSCFGSRHINTPELDLLAAQGVKLTDAYANSPVCSCTRLALATGRYNTYFRTGRVEPFSAGEWGETAIPEGYDTYMKLLQQAGYRTSLVGKWHLGPTEKGSPLNFGFDEFFGFLGGGLDYFTHEYLGEPALMEGRDPIEREGYMTTLLADEAIRRIEAAVADGQSFAMNLHFNAPHWPWEGPEDFALGTQGNHNDGGSLEVYAAMTESMDRNIGRVLRAVDNLGLTHDTLVIFTSDNGGERYSEVWPFRGTKGYLLEGGIRVPAIIRYPRALRGGLVSDQMVATMDYFPTMLQAAGVGYDAGAVDGMPLLDFLASGRRQERTLFFNFQGHDQRAVRRGNWKWYSIEGNEFLYDLSADSHERANRKDAEADLHAELKAAWEAWDATQSPRDGMPGYCGTPAGQALELPQLEASNCKVYSGRGGG